MKKLNVIDLDGTLIHQDSFRQLLLRNKSVALLQAVVLRKLRLISRAKASELYAKSIREVLDNKDCMRIFSTEIATTIRKDILQKITQHSDTNTVNLLLSASPIEYVALLAADLGFEGMASRFINKPFFHCYGANKLAYIRQHFPESDFHYHFAISDSRSDLMMMQQFEHYELC